MVLRPTSRPFVTGIAFSYSNVWQGAQCPKLLEPFQDQSYETLLSEEEFNILMKSVNDTIRCFWPCGIVLGIGYLLSPFTIGASFYMPNLCIHDAKKRLISVIARNNRLKLNERGLHLVYVEGAGTSWLELRRLTLKVSTD